MAIRPLRFSFRQTPYRIYKRHTSTWNNLCLPVRSVSTIGSIYDHGVSECIFHSFSTALISRGFHELFAIIPKVLEIRKGKTKRIARIDVNHGSRTLDNLKQSSFHTIFESNISKSDILTKNNIQKFLTHGAFFLSSYTRQIWMASPCSTLFR